VQTPRVLTNWGDLYLRTHQYGEAASLYREALLMGAEYLPARVGLASALASQYAGGARDEVLGILDDHPDSIPANLLLARRRSYWTGPILASGPRSHSAKTLDMVVFMQPLHIFTSLPTVIGKRWTCIEKRFELNRLWLLHILNWE